SAFRFHEHTRCRVVHNRGVGPTWEGRDTGLERDRWRRIVASRGSVLAMDEFDDAQGGCQRPRVMVIGHLQWAGPRYCARRRLTAGRGLPANRKENRWQR